MTLALEMASGTPSSPLDDDNDANDSCIVKIAPTISLRILEDVSSSSSDNSDADADDDDNAELVVEDGNNNKTDYNVDDKVEDSVGRFIWPTAVPLLRHIIHSSGCGNNRKASCTRLIVELGAGCGVLGMGLLAAALQEQQQQSPEMAVANDINHKLHVILTDHDSEWLERNVALNATSLLQNEDVVTCSSSSTPACTTTLEVAKLDWRKQQDIEIVQNMILTNLSTMGARGSNYSNNTELWLVGSDILYNHDSHQPLVSTLYNLSSHAVAMASANPPCCRIIIGFPDRNNDENNFLPIARNSFGDGFPSSKPLNIINYNNGKSSDIKKKKKSMDLRIIDYFVVN